MFYLLNMNACDVLNHINNVQITNFSSQDFVSDNKTFKISKIEFKNEKVSNYQI